MDNKNIRHSKSCFTLLEVLVAVFILSLIMLVVGTAMYMAKESLEKVDTKTRTLDVYLKLDKVFTSSIRNAVPFTWPDSENIEKSIFEGGRDSLYFAYLHRIITLSDGGLRFIRFHLQDSKFIAEYRKIPFSSESEYKESVFKEVLAEDIEELTFLYAGNEKGSSNIIWTNEWEDPKNIPLAIQITLKWKDGTQYSWLRRTAGSGRYQSYGVRDEE